MTPENYSIARQACRTEAARMFSAIQNVYTTSLSDIRSGTSTDATLFADLLDTPSGQAFANSVGRRSDIELGASLIASERAPSTSERSESSSSDSRAPIPSDPTPNPSGLGCVPIDPYPSIYGPDMSVRLKTAVLNCLIFDTPHSFWSDTASTNQLKSRIDNGPYTWLGRDDWQCTGVPGTDGPHQLAACLKHDVAYGSLIEFYGSSNIRDLDVAWNPRNRAVADSLLALDFMCGVQTGPQGRECVQQASRDHSWSEVIANYTWWYPRMFSFLQKWGLENYLRVSLPVTRLEFDDSAAKPYYVACQVPTIDINGIEQIDERTFIARWTQKASCISGVTYSLTRVVWRTVVGNPPSRSWYNISPVANNATSATFTVIPIVNLDRYPLKEVILDKVLLEPDVEVKYGGGEYWQPINFRFEVP